jgi:hypothetical protein
MPTINANEFARARLLVASITDAKIGGPSIKPMAAGITAN